MGSDSSVLNDIKSFLLIPEEIKDFDQTLILHINSQLVYLKQLGYGEDLPDEISDATTTWNDVVGDYYNSDLKLLVGLRVKLVFDTPAVGSVTAAMERQISDAEWRVHARREVIT
jgi:hypothetical protein